MTYRSPRPGSAAGALLGRRHRSATPAMAATQSTCVYNTSNKNLVVTDNSGSRPLELGTDAGVIRIADGPEAFVSPCPRSVRSPASPHRADRGLRRARAAGRRLHGQPEQRPRSPGRDA